MSLCLHVTSCHCHSGKLKASVASQEENSLEGASLACASFLYSLLCFVSTSGSATVLLQGISNRITIFAIWNLLLTLCSTQLVIYPCKMGTIIRPDITTWYILLTLFEEVAAHVDIEFITTNLSRVKTIPWSIEYWGVFTFTNISIKIPAIRYHWMISVKGWTSLHCHIIKLGSPATSPAAS